MPLAVDLHVNGKVYVYCKAKSHRNL